MTLLVSREVDRLLRYPRGRSLRLAKAGKLPFITLPDGEVRFDQKEIERIVAESARGPVAERQEVDHA